MHFGKYWFEMMYGCFSIASENILHIQMTLRWRWLIDWFMYTALIYVASEEYLGAVEPRNKTLNKKYMSNESINNALRNIVV